MRVFAICLVLSATTCVSAFASVDSILQADYPRIAGFYSDLNYVSENSTPVERVGMVKEILRGGRPDMPLWERRSRIFSAIARTRKAVLFPDPTMAFGLISIPDYARTVLPLELTLRTKDRVIIKVERRSEPKSIAFPPGSGLLGARDTTPASIEFDTWTLVDGTWMIDECHACLL